MATQCKLYRDRPQVIPPGEWTLLVFDRAIRNDRSMAKSTTLIVPKLDGDFVWSRNIRWGAVASLAGDTRQRQFMSRFVRDPLGEPDDTGAADHLVTPGRSWETTTWQFYGEAGVPIGVQVWHDHHEPWAVEHAQFVGTTWDY